MKDFYIGMHRKSGERTVARRVSRYLMMGIMAVMMSLGLSSCYVDAGWNPAPPGGWTTTFYDSRLDGYWELYTVNGRYVNGDMVNYLYFNGNGRGRYYYYNNGMRYWENTAYWCQDSNNGNSYYQINLQYESSGSPTTMNYWFSDGTRYLTMEWRNSYGWQSYVYVFYPYGSPW